MKKTILILAIALGAINLHAQDSTFMYYFTDELESVTYYMPTSDLVVSNTDKTEGAIIGFHLTYEGEFSFLTATLIGLGNCNEEDKMIILFEDGSKINLVSWNKFNCEGTAYFNLSAEQKEKLSTIPVKTIRVTNGHSYESVTSSKGYNKRYFIQAFYSIDNKLFTLFNPK
tara:strand:- start:225 stop:737 length:513 start_codon:yes stop_codon:yes gene_type:complete